MLRYTIALLLGLATAAEKPLSAQDDGENSIQLYLKRDTQYSPSYFYYPMVIHGQSYNLQPSSFDQNVGIIGSECTDKCKGMSKIELAAIAPITNLADEEHFKDFMEENDKFTGFYYQPFRGYYQQAMCTISDVDNQSHIVNNFPIFVIQRPSKKDKDHYYSKQSGFLGLGPWTGDLQNNENVPTNFVKKLREQAQVQRDTISYNIQWMDNKNSYIQIGDVSKMIREKTRYQQAQSFKHFGLAVTEPFFFRADTKLQSPFPPGVSAQAIFDPQVDYMYVNELEFKNWIAPHLRLNYLDTGLDCDQLQCWWNKPCSQITKTKLEIKFKLGHQLAKEQDIVINLEDFLVDSKDMGFEKEAADSKTQKCYLPIFVSNPGQVAEAFNVWWLGNMFLDRYFVIHDSEGADQKSNPPKYPLVGIYDKVNPTVPTDREIQPMPSNLNPLNPKDNSGSKGKDTTNLDGGSSKPKTDTDPTDDSGGMGAGWVILILLIVFGGLAAVYKFFGESIKERLNGGGTGTFHAGQV